jgi:dienelactone hydrolase
MRPFEIATVSLLLIASVFLMFGKWRRWTLLLVCACLAAFAAHAILEGVHWQMSPAYLGLVLIALMTWRQAFYAGGARLRVTLAGVAIASGLAAVAFSSILPVFRLPDPTGPYAVGTTILYMKDASRVEDAAPVAGAPRELMVQLWYPAQPSSNRLERYQDPRELRWITSYRSLVVTHSRVDAPVLAAGSPFPVVLFNPGWHGRRTQNTSLSEELASHGYVVAAIDHTYNSGEVVFPDGRVIHGNASEAVVEPEISTPERVRAIWDKELVKWTADQRFVLDQLAELNRKPGSLLSGRLNTEQSVAVGHSFGGSAAVEACARDPRIHGAVNMDGWFFDAIRQRSAKQPLMFMEEYSGVPQPTLVAANAGVEATLDAADERDLESSLNRFGGYRVSVRGAYHEDFTDQALMSPLAPVAQRGSIPAEEMHRIVREYVLAFVDKILRGKDSELLRANASPFQEVTLKIWPGGGDGATPMLNSSVSPSANASLAANADSKSGVGHAPQPDPSHRPSPAITR